jgi:YHS domain-containing protein
MSTKISIKPGPWMLALLLAAAGAGLACQQDAGNSAATATPVAAPAAGVQTAALRKIEDPKKVCMVNNTVFEKDQIPVEVEGKTYYGCCEMCKERLAKDESARYATDPVTGARVDKATAVIAAQGDGTALYFENDANFEEYAKRNS